MSTLDVIKWGWENAWLLKSNSEVLSQTEGKKVIVVSAMRSDDFNTTSKLIEISNSLRNKKISYIPHMSSLISDLKNFHLQKLSENGSDDILLQECERIFEILRGIMSSIIYVSPWEQIIPEESNDFTIRYQERGCDKNLSLLGFGEYISARLNVLYMQQVLWKSVGSLERLPWPDTSFYASMWKISSQVRGIMQDKDIVLVPGYLPGTWSNILETIGRGYSDATASLVALSMKQEGYEVTLGVEKMVDGFMSADPRVLQWTWEEAQLIPELSYILAKEIITEKWPEAKLLHPKSLDRRIQAWDIPVHLYNPFSASSGTIISGTTENIPEWILYIGWVQDIEALVYSSWRMEQGFIAETNTALADIGINVKEILWSGTEHTSLFSPSDISIEDMKWIMMDRFWLTAPEAWEFVEHRNNYSLVYCVGNMKDIIGSLDQVTSCLKNNSINVKWFSQWLEQRAMAIVVDKSDYKKTILALHDELILKK